MHRIRALVERMDQPFADDYEVIELRHARAGELSEQLRMLAQEGSEDLGSPQVLADRRSNAIILSGREESRLRLRGLVAQLDREMEEGNVRVHYLRYARAEEVAELLRNIAEQHPGLDADEPTGSGIHIESHEPTNAVVTYGPPDFIRDFDVIVEQLDIRRAQVLVEAVIAEVSSDRVQDLGVQWGPSEAAVPVSSTSLKPVRAESLSSPPVWRHSLTGAFPLPQASGTASPSGG